MNIKSIIASSAMIIAGAAIASADMFTDVPSTHWAYQAVSSLSEQGIIDGFPDNTFKGNQNVTRYQLALITAKLLAKVEQGGIGNNDVNTVEKLTVEFADELALLGVKVTSLEDDMQVLKDDVAGLKTDMNTIKSSMTKGEFEKVKLSGEMLVRHTSIDEKELGRDVRTGTKLRLRMDAQVAENVKAVARWNVVNNNHDTAAAGFPGAAWNGSNHATSEVDTAYLQINDMFGFGGDFTFGRRFLSHGHGLVINNFHDAVTYNKTSGDVELSFNLIFDDSMGGSTYNKWNINADTKFRGHDLYLGLYYSSVAKAALVDSYAAIDPTYFDNLHDNSGITEIEFGAKGDLGNNGYWSYDLGAVYQINKNFAQKDEDPTQYKDEKGWMLHGAINWDSKEQWAMKVAYTMVEEETYMRDISFDERYNDGIESPLEDIMRGGNFDNNYAFGDMANSYIITNIQDVKVQLEYRPSKTSKHYFRLAYDMVKNKNNDYASNYFYGGDDASDKADVINAEYRYRIAENTRIRLGYTDFKFGSGKDVNQTVADGTPNIHRRDYGMFWAEIYSHF